jgi:nitroreductase
MTNSEDGVKLTAGDIPIPATNMSVYEALYSRRMAWQFKDAAVPREALERMLETAVWAPNHRLTEPWRFFVLDKGSKARHQAADLAYEFQLGRSNNPTRAEGSRQSILDPPIVMFVYSVPGPNDDTTQENYASVCCAAHNISLAGMAEGLAVTWETGGSTRHPQLKTVLGAEEDWQLVTMLSIGVPAESPASVRTPVTGFVHWFE